ncbi:hypothetical protein C8Q76DRAFT_799571 [Earliella scabrosa]|nr:hypothetical protein C8Q76DRAFT_799571 [Earliella scabrosa]
MTVTKQQFATVIVDLKQLASQLDYVLESDEISVTLSDSIDELVVLDTLLTMIWSRLRTIINALKPIHRLPRETLADVFSLVPDRYLPKKDSTLAPIWGPLGIGPAQHLAPLTAVCKRWRDILLEEQRLWSDVEDNGGEQLPKYVHYLDRNSTGPLYVSLPNGRLHPSTQLILRQSGHRIRELRIICDTAADGEDVAIRGALSFSADQLQVCRLERVGFRGMPAIPLFDGHAPQLRALQMNYCTSIPSHGFPSLTHLVLDVPSGSHTSIVTTLIVNFLRDCSSLQVVRIYASMLLEDAPTIGRSTARDVHLPRLRKLSLSGDANDFKIEICSRLVFPPQCFVSALQYEIPEGHGVFHLADALAGSTTSDYTSMQVTIALSPLQRLYFHINLFDSTRSAGIHLVVNDNARWFADHTAPLLPRLLIDGSLLSSRLFNSVRTLEIGGCKICGPGVGCNPISVILHALPMIDTLFIKTPIGNQDLVEELRVLLPSSRDAPAVYPLLTTLAIEMPAVIDLGLIIILAVARRLAGHPLSRIVLKLTTSDDLSVLPDEIRGAMEGVVDEVVVVHPLEGGHPETPEELRWMDTTLPPGCTAQGELPDRWWQSWDYVGLPHYSLPV